MTIPAVPESGATVKLRLKKSDKIRFKSQFDQIRREGVKSASPGIVAIVAPPPDGILECGVICSKKYSLRAVVRNRARRLLWESFRKLKPEMLPCRVLLIPRRRMMSYKCDQATQELAGLLVRQKVLPENVLLRWHGY